MTPTKYHGRKVSLMAEILCVTCKEWRPHRAKGLCIKCYGRIPRRLITCISCGERKPHEARQLCRQCYKNTGPTTPHLKHSLGLIKTDEDDKRDSLRVPPLGPTLARPGTEAKVLVLIARHNRFETLYHPHDCVIPKEIEGGGSKRIDGGWHNGAQIFHTPDCDD